MKVGQVLTATRSASGTERLSLYLICHNTSAPGYTRLAKGIKILTATRSASGTAATAAGPATGAARATKGRARVKA
jgi:hypothetical protein